MRRRPRDVGRPRVQRPGLPARSAAQDPAPAPTLRGARARALGSRSMVARTARTPGRPSTPAPMLWLPARRSSALRITPRRSTACGRTRRRTDRTAAVKAGRVGHRRPGAGSGRVGNILRAQRLLGHWRVARARVITNTFSDLRMTLANSRWNRIALRRWREDDARRRHGARRHDAHA